ncbi:ATP-grasp domain-containing protein [Lunatimonas salinarum]|uniref:carboxylate--amine ligase n=1 Tax=Lunatimonas salinarum TaxID=1774590 RepID=UPI001ADFB6F3|nr:ATP-grasp domain-containing protein [Lunatimonas salinarum]
MDSSIAVTYSWNRMAYIVNKSLSSKGIKVHTGDSSFLHMNRLSLYSNSCFRYPNFYQDPLGFVNYLKNYLNTNEIPFLIPTHEEVFIVSKYLDQFGGVKTVVADFENLKTAHKKELSVSLAKSLGVNVPDSIQPHSREDCLHFFSHHQKPIVLKYGNSNSSKGVFYISQVPELESHLPNLGDFILQEYVHGDGYGVSMLYNQGEKRAIFTHKRLEEKISTGGTSTLRVSCRNELLEEWAEKMLNHLHWNGVAMVEFKYNEVEKKGWFIEINPRFWGSLALPYFSGMDFPYLYYKILQDGDIKFTSKYKEGVKVKWLLGGLIGFAGGLIKERKFYWDHLSLNADHFDDFSFRDPFVLLGEAGYYAEKLLSTMNLNPTEDSSLNIDKL